MEGSSGTTKGKKAAPSYRRGKWTAEEEAYSSRLITEFKLGLLPLTDGTTLRTFLSKLLNCDPMRISKKFVGQNCIGKVRERFLALSTSPPTRDTFLPIMGKGETNWPFLTPSNPPPPPTPTASISSSTVGH